MPRPDSPKSFIKAYYKTPYAAIDPTQLSLSAIGKTVLITVGHTGIGFSVAQNFAIAEASHVILPARRTEILEKSTNKLSFKYPKTKFHHFASSITDYIRITDIFSEIRFKVSPDIDVLVLSAVVYAATPADSLDLSSQQLAVSFDTNCLANANLVKSTSMSKSPARRKSSWIYEP